MAINLDKYFTVSELGKRWGISRQAVDQRIRRDKLPTLNIILKSRLVRLVSKWDILSYENERK